MPICKLIRPRVGVRSAKAGGVHLCAIRPGRAQLPKDRVGHPRHLIAFSFDASELRILRVLHESMDVEARLGDA
jgi:plasmid stabilization system protein ParE